MVAICTFLTAVPGHMLGVNGTCPQPYKGIDKICDRMGDTCMLDNDCLDKNNSKCCFNGCQRECLDAIPASLPPGMGLICEITKRLTNRLTNCMTD
jgi:hypothetical protein